MNESRRRIIRERMGEVGLSQDRLAERINECRKQRSEREGVKTGEVTCHAMSRAINHAGNVPPLLRDILDALSLEVAVKPVNALDLELTAQSKGGERKA